MKHLFWIFLALLLVSVANAADYGTYNYKYWVPKKIRAYLQEVDAVAPTEGAPSCSSFYKKVLNKGVLEIRYALGYFDDSTGEERIVDGKNYGLSPSLDIDMFYSLRGELKASCGETKKRLCGFSEIGDPKSGKLIFTKFVEIHGMPVMVKLTLTQASASTSFLNNKETLVSRQAFLTRQSEDNFFEGLKTADVVFYNGHSRNGGGPDFAPPILNSRRKTDYKGYYEVKRPGILRTLQTLQALPGEKPVVGFFSCYSQKHFLDSFLKMNAHQKLILTTATIDNFDTMEASVGYLEGILRGSCGDELENLARRTQKTIDGFKGYNLN